MKNLVQVKEMQESLRVMRMHNPMREMQESLKTLRMHNPMSEMQESLKALRMHNPMIEMQESLKTLRMHYPMREMQESLKALKMHGSMKEIRESLKAVGSFGEFDTELPSNCWPLEIESNFRFTHSFQSVEKILSNQNIGIPIEIVQEFKKFSELVAENLQNGQNTNEIRRTVENLAENYHDNSIKLYTFSEVMQTIILYVSFLITLHTMITNADKVILSNQEDIMKRQQEIESKIDISISQNEALLETIYKVDSNELGSFLVTQNRSKVRMEPNANSEEKFELKANSVIKILEKEKNFARIVFFDFENHVYVEGWIPLRNCESIKPYLEN